MSKDDHKPQLDEFLSDQTTPLPDDNRRKTALNLAIAEFDQYQKEQSQKKYQGKGLLSRLIGKSTNNDRRSSMSNKRFFYGGLATAMVVVLAGSAAFFQAQEQNIIARDQEKSELETVQQDLEQLSKQDSAVAPQNSVSELLPNMSAMFSGRSSTDQASQVTNLSSTQMAPHTTQRLSADDVYDPVQAPPDAGKDLFEEHEISPVKAVSEAPVSTFSIDVDTASYSYVRRMLNRGRLPSPDAVRIEEMVNYFDYDYAGPETRDPPFKANISVVPSPWKEGNKLIHIGLKGYDIEPAEQPRANLVFLLDISGSMNQQDKLPLLINSFKLLLNSLQPEDTISIVTYAGRSGTALEPTSVKDKQKILNTLENLRAGGSTAGASGIKGAYALASQNFDETAVNRVILATDGDFNVGISDTEQLKDLIEKKRESGVFLSVLGFGQGNLNDHLMQTLAQNGNGIAAHIDNLNEARKVLVEEATSTLFPIAKDVKIQVEFNPLSVSEYRLIGYETRALAKEDFNNDQVDAGDIGAGHSVTAIYEIVPKGSGNELIDPSRYEPIQETDAATDFGDEYAFLKMRYKMPDEDSSQLITTPITTENEMMNDKYRHSAGYDLNFAVAVAGFGQLLKDEKYLSKEFSYNEVLALAQKGRGEDKFGYRAEFMKLVRLAQSLEQTE